MIGDVVKVTDEVIAVLDRYRDRIEQAARDDKQGLTTAKVGPYNWLFPTQAHAIWMKAHHAETAKEAEEMMEAFLGRVEKEQ